MITLGIDLSSQDKDTAACIIQWCNSEAIAKPPRSRCSDADLDSLVEAADAIGIDAPFGWPEAFVEATSGWTHRAWTRELRDSLRFRETDRVTRRETGRWPLSVSSDLVALPAMRAMSLLKRHGVDDKSGADQRFYEVYPAGSLRMWGAYVARYKQDASKRLEILALIRERLPRLKVLDSHASADHNLDALVTSLTARAAAQGLTLRPEKNQQAQAKREGWIHLPQRWPKF